MPIKLQRSQKLFVKHLAAFASEVQRENKLGMFVIRAHLLVEQMLNDVLIEHLAMSPDELDELGLRFAQKIKMASHLEHFEPVVTKSIQALNKIRNKCAHDIRYVPSEPEFRSFWHEVGAQFPLAKVDEDSFGMLTRYVAFLVGYLFPGDLLQS
jgi:hypothetical protein